jgi:hypothetical protein
MTLRSGPPALPSPSVSADQVVLAQLAGLQSEAVDSPSPGAGLRACWEFASPGNRTATGPLEHFALMLRNPRYVGLLGHRTVHLGPLVVDGDQARQEVLVLTADDRTEGYTWVLSRQDEAPHEGCWMTDGVLRHDVGDGA